MVEVIDVLLAMLKVDVGIMTDAYNERLSQYLIQAIAEITREGATLDSSSLDDRETVVMYAGWMWRKRDTGEGMPRMLRYRLNNRIFSEKARDTDD